MKNKIEVTPNLLLGCTVLRITRELSGAATISMLEHAAGMSGYRLQHLLYRSDTRLMGSILPYILYGKRTEEFFWRYGLRACMKDLNSIR